MKCSTQYKNERKPLIFALKFILFILIFALLTLGMQYCFHKLLRSKGGLFGVADTLENAENTSPKRIVVLDAGHGGEDGGTSAADGTLEKDLNLSVALLLADYLRADGIEVILTRDSDRLLYDPTTDYKGRKKLLDLKARLEIGRSIASEHTDSEVLFISIHMNSYPSESVRGLQVWYSPNHPASERLAESIQNTADTLLMPENERKIKKAGSNIFLLDRLELPSVLVECGFLSNASEAALLSDENYRRELAYAIFTAVMNYTSSDSIDSEGSAITDSIVPLTP